MPYTETRPEDIVVPETSIAHALRNVHPKPRRAHYSIADGKRRCQDALQASKMAHIVLVLFHC